jgi:hypothetical protein
LKITTKTFRNSGSAYFFVNIGPSPPPQAWGDRGQTAWYKKVKGKGKAGNDIPYIILRKFVKAKPLKWIEHLSEY